MVFLMYLDDEIIAGFDSQEIDDIICKLCEPQNNIKSGFELTNNGDITDYLSFNMEELKNGKIKLFQTHLIDSIIEDIRLRTSKQYWLLQPPYWITKKEKSHIEQSAAIRG